MSAQLKAKLVRLYGLIEQTCNSSVRRFNREKGHTSRSVGFTAYEERQKKLKDLSKEHPDIIEFLCRKGCHDHFKFEGKSMKVVSAARENLGRNVFDKKSVEREQEEFGNFDPLIRVTYKADYHIDDHEANILECHYLEIDRNTEEVINEYDLMRLAKDNSAVTSELAQTLPTAVELPESGLLFSNENKREDSL